MLGGRGFRAAAAAAAGTQPTADGTADPEAGSETSAAAAVPAQLLGGRYATRSAQTLSFGPLGLPNVCQLVLCCIDDPALDAASHGAVKPGNTASGARAADGPPAAQLAWHSAALGQPTLQRGLAQAWL